MAKHDLKAFPEIGKPLPSLFISKATVAEPPQLWAVIICKPDPQSHGRIFLS